MRRASLVSRSAVVAAACACLAMPAASSGAAARHCRAVVDPYPGTGYDGVDLSSIRATGVRCAVARRVARGAHAEAIRPPLPSGGIERFTWRGWRVKGDIRPASDRYVAVRDSDRVRWRF